jgi:hypothetical protein
VTGDRDSYQYLVESIRKFPDQERFAAMIRAAGFERVSYRNYTSASRRSIPAGASECAGRQPLAAGAHGGDLRAHRRAARRARGAGGAAADPRWPARILGWPLSPLG